MSLETTGMALLCALAAVDLLLTFGVIRRLREHSDELGRLSGEAADGRAAGSLVGRRLADFEGRTTDGGTVSRQRLLGKERVIGFFKVGCEPCDEQAPRFADWAEDNLRLGGERPLVVVTGGEGSEGDAFGVLDRLEKAAAVVLRPDSETIAGAVGVHGFPTVLRTSADGVIEVDGYSVDDLRGGRPS